MSGPTKAELLEQLDRARADADAATDAALNAERERDLARRQLQETLTSEQQLRAAFKLTGHLNAGLRKQLDAERETRSRVEGDLRAKLEKVDRLNDRLCEDGEEASAELADARNELARITQTSHDREAALLGAITALARRTP